MRRNIPIRIKNVENPSGSGTVILPHTHPSHPRHMQKQQISGIPFTSISATTPSQEERLPTAVTFKDNIAVINVHSNRRSVSHGFLAAIFREVDRSVPTSPVSYRITFMTDRLTSSQIRNPNRPPKHERSPSINGHRPPPIRNRAPPSTLQNPPPRPHKNSPPNPFPSPIRNNLLPIAHGHPLARRFPNGFPHRYEWKDVHYPR
jgi:hypothetical protein